MKTLYFVLLFEIFLILGSSSLDAQNTHIKSQVLDRAQGLDNLFVYALTKDTHNRIWAATKTGLNVYDGYEFKTFPWLDFDLDGQNYIGDIKVLGEDRIVLFSGRHHVQTILPPEWGPPLNLLAVSEIIYFDPIKKEISNKQSAEELSSVFSIHQDTLLVPLSYNIYNEQWLSTSKGQLWRLGKDSLRKVLQNPDANPIEFIAESPEHYLAGDWNTVFKINKASGAVKEVSIPGRLARIIHNSMGTWIVAYDPKLQVYRIWELLAGNTLKEMVFSKNNRPFYASAAPDITRHLIANPAGIWTIPQEDSLYFFSPTGKLLHQQSNEQFYMSHWIKQHVFNDQHFFVGTTAGIGLLNFSTSNFEISLNRTPRLCDTRGISAGPDSSILFLDYWLYQWDPIKKSLKKLSEDIYLGHAVAYINEKILVGRSTFDSPYMFFFLDKNGQKIKSIPQTDLLEATLILKITQNPLIAHQYFLGTEKGIIIWDDLANKYLTIPNEAQFPELKEYRIQDIYFTERDTYWLATDHGLYKASLQLGILKVYNKKNGYLPLDDIIHIHQDKHKQLWLATRGKGLVRWEEPNPGVLPNSNYECYTTEHNLSNNYLNGIYGDQQDRIWVSTDQGISCFDKNSKTFRKYDQIYGINSQEFNKTSHYQSTNGTTYFGGQGGLINFQPERFNTLASPNTPLIIQRFYVQSKGQMHPIDQTQSLLKDSVIIFDKDDRFIELSFALVNYDEPEKHQYQYQIVGYDNFWRTMSNNQLRITNLPYGKYQLRVRAASKGEAWSSQQIDLPLIFQKPFYLRSWFLLCVGLIIVFASLYIPYLRIVRLSKRKQNLEEEINKRTLEIAQDKDKIAIQAKQLRALNQVKTNFFNNITHEIRTPLSLIIGPASELKIADELAANEKKKVDQILMNAEKMQLLFDELLKLEKLEKQGISIHLSSIKINTLFAEILKRFQVPAKNHKINLVGHFENLGSLQLMLDLRKLERVVVNLLSNAIKFTEPGGKVILAAKWNNSQLELSVEDTGIGIAEKDLPSLFDRYFQVNDGESKLGKGGFGIGLALCKEYVELMQGKILVESQLGKGSLFRVQIPAEQSITPAESFASSPPLGITPKSYKPALSNVRISILIVEDNHSLADYLREVLRTNYAIYLAHNGAEALAILKGQKIDLILSDVMMPIMDGFELLKEVNQLFREERMPFLFLTAISDRDRKQSAFRLGVDDYLQKPFFPEELQHRIATLLENYQARKMAKTQFINASDRLSEDEQWINNLEKICQESLQSPDFSTAKLALALNMSERNLFIKVKLHTGMSPGQYIREVRLIQAKRWIEEGTYHRVSELAFAVGFKKVSYFSQIFKKRFGRLPSEMLK